MSHSSQGTAALMQKSRHHYLLNMGVSWRLPSWPSPKTRVFSPTDQAVFSKHHPFYFA